MLELKGTNSVRARDYYQDTIQSNLTTLVGLLDQVVDRGTVLSSESAADMERTLSIMHFTTLIGLSISLICLISLVLYVLSRVVKPIILITRGAGPLHEGRLDQIGRAHV